MPEIKLDYDAEQQAAVLTFENGRTLRLSNISEERARAFRDRHAAEFAKRDCMLETPSNVLTRDA